MQSKRFISKKITNENLIGYSNWKSSFSSKAPSTEDSLAVQAQSKHLYEYWLGRLALEGFYLSEDEQRENLSLFLYANSNFEETNTDKELTGFNWPKKLSIPEENSIDNRAKRSFNMANSF